jgi:hypothetical protein
MAPRHTGLLTMWLAACATAAEPPGGSGAGEDASIDATTSTGSADGAMPGCAQAFAGTLATWDFTTEPGNQPSTAVKMTATGVTAGPIQRAPTLTTVAGANSINSSNWSTAAQPDTSKYYAFTITPPSGCTLSIATLALDAKASPTGPAMAAVATSINAFTQPVAISTAVPSTPSLATAAQSSMIEVRVFGFGAMATNGTLRLQGTLSIMGSLQ